MISTQWTSHLANKKEEKEEFERYLQNNQRVLIRLREIVEEKEAALDRIDLSLSAYDNPNWSYKQAFINGRRADLNEFKLLLSI